MTGFDGVVMHCAKRNTKPQFGAVVHPIMGVITVRLCEILPHRLICRSDAMVFDEIDN